MIINKTIGIIGGGQLARMLALSAYPLGFRIAIYSNEVDSPATLITNNSIIGDYNDEKKILKFSEIVDFLTFEFENIDYKILHKIEEKFPEKLKPNSNSLFISNNRIREKNFFNSIGIETTKFFEIKNFEELRKIIISENNSYILKTAENGYDGKGQFKINNSFDLPDIQEFLNFEKTQYILEKVINFKKEISIILVRKKNGEIDFFPIPENIHSNGILKTSSVPNFLSEAINYKVQEIGKEIADKLDYVGVMAIEFFITEDGEILANEMAPRVHNSGHFTQNSCNICQFEAHIRAITDLEIRKIKLLSPCKMRNLIGEEIDYVQEFFSMENGYPHIYGKSIIKPGRKMGHVNILKTKINEDQNENQEIEFWDETLLNDLIEKNK